MISNASLAACAAVNLLVLTLASAAAGPPPRIPPDWLADYWSRAVGTWVAANDEHRAANEPYDAYGIEWRWGVGRKSVTGRLYALVDGRDVGTLFEYREFWHPGDGAVVVEQFGSDGTYGVGKLERRDDGTIALLQTFHDPAGTSYRTGHTLELKGDVRVTRQYEVDRDGAWKEGRTYLFRRSGDR